MFKKYIDENGHEVWSTAETREKFEFFEKIAKSGDDSFRNKFTKIDNIKFDMILTRYFDNIFDLAEYIYQTIHYAQFKNDVVLMDIQIDFEQLATQVCFNRK